MKICNKVTVDVTTGRAGKIWRFIHTIYDLVGTNMSIAHSLKGVETSVNRGKFMRNSGLYTPKATYCIVF